MKVLVINSGSSSIKYQLLVMPEGTVLAAGAVERIGEAGKCHHVRQDDGNTVEIAADDVNDHRGGLEHIIATLTASGVVTKLSELFAIGHRVVHGGESFRQPTRIDTTVIEQIRVMIPLAPLHNPSNLLGIEVALNTAPGVPQVAVFDTAFHHTIPDYAYHYALPRRFYAEYKVRRYGFHGTSHSYVAQQAARFLQRPLEQLNLITLHLGNGASAAAIAAGRCVETSMGMTPLEGLVMGTRCGDIDPAIHFYLGRTASLSEQELEDLLNRESGLKGICGSNDMREVHRLAADGDDQARLALAMVCHRLKKYIGAYYAVLGRLDALVFTAGIGENDAWLRAATCAGLETLGIRINEQANTQATDRDRAIHHTESPVAILVVPTNEEFEIARQVVDCLHPGGTSAPPWSAA
jgi:acetate kinase